MIKVLLVIVVIGLRCVSSECPVCDLNDYNPVCSSGKAFQSICHLRRQLCLGNVDLTSEFYGQCQRIVNREAPLAAVVPSEVRGVTLRRQQTPKCVPTKTYPVAPINRLPQDLAALKFTKEEFFEYMFQRLLSM